MDDPSYKRLLQHKRVVRDLLVGFVAPKRPPGWADVLHFDTLREGPTEGVSDDLRRRIGDVVWAIDRRDERGGVHTLHLVIEHQSSVDHSMPLRLLNYTSLLYQRLYRERKRWRKGDTADPVQHVVVYNGARTWDAPMDLADMIGGNAHDGPAQITLRYDLLDLVATARDDLPRSNALSWVAQVEQSIHAGALPERVRELGEWLAEESEPGLTTTFDLWLGVLERKWGIKLPSLAQPEEVSTMLLEKIDQWEAEFLEKGREQGFAQGREQGIAREKALLCRLAARKFGPEAASRLSASLAGVTDAERLDEAGEWIVDCTTSAELLARVDCTGS